MDLGIKMGFVWECGGGNSKKPESRRRSMMIFPLKSCFSKWGAAFCIEGGPEKERQAMEYLERRESEYDLKARVDFYSEDDPLKPAVTGCLVFTSTLSKISNKYYLGPAGLEDMASQIATATGPCGNNRDYLFKLEKALADIGHEDEMVTELANEVRNVLARIEGPKEESTQVESL